jgi:hypothetical protein
MAPKSNTRGRKAQPKRAARKSNNSNVTPARRRPTRARPARSGPRRARPNPGRVVHADGTGHIGNISFDPWLSPECGAPMGLGNAVCIPNIIRHTVPQYNYVQIVIVTNTGDSNSVGIRVSNSPTPGIAVLSGTFLGATGTAGGPTEGKAVKIGCSLINGTEPLNTEGFVYVLVTDRRLALPQAPSTMTQAEWATFSNEIINHPDAVTHTASSMLGGGKKFVGTPRDLNDYSDWRFWSGALGTDAFMGHVANWPGGNNLLQPMETLVLVLPVTANAQDYRLTVRSSYYTRWPLDAVLSTAAKPIPHAPLASFHSATNAVDPVSQATGTPLTPARSGPRDSRVVAYQ